MKKKLSDILRTNKEIHIRIDMAYGKSTATAFGCDMTEEYVRINAAYMT